MHGDPKIIEALNDILTAELTAINQYFVHFRMCDNWGYDKLAKKKRAESLEEMAHADKIIDRILYLEGVPNVQRLYAVRVGQDATEQHQLDLEMEKSAVERYNKAISLCRESGDNGTRELLVQLLKEEEEAVDWLEAQMHIIREIGKEHYLAQQIHS